METRIEPDLFSHILPSEIYYLIGVGYLDSSLYNLLKTSTYFYNFFITELKKAYPKFHETNRRLLSHAALGEWEEAKMLRSQFPIGVTSFPGTIYHPNLFYFKDAKPKPIPLDWNPGQNKYVDLTAWQIALMNEEYDVAEEMEADMSFAERHKQFWQIFPDGKIRNYRFDLKKVEELLTKVFYEIAYDGYIDINLDKMNNKTKLALDELYNYVKPAAEHKQGLVFNDMIYLMALKLYENDNKQFRGWRNKSIWCIKVEEYLASLLTTNDLRVHIKSLDAYKITVKKYDSKIVDKTSYHAFRRNDKSVPGNDFFVAPAGGVSARGGIRRGYVEPGSASDKFSKHMAIKTEKRLAFEKKYAPVINSENSQEQELISKKSLS